jgi:hypothetical protein
MVGLTLRALVRAIGGSKHGRRRKGSGGQGGKTGALPRDMLLGVAN